MITLDKIMAFIAPHTCLFCCNQGLIMCGQCMSKIATNKPLCYGCGNEIMNEESCPQCVNSKPINRLYYVTRYTDKYKDLLLHFKYFGAQEAGIIISKLMAKQLGSMYGFHITYIPTSPSRARTRGYDQSQLLAHKISVTIGIKFVKYLIRQTKTRQVGSNRFIRLDQAKNSYRVINVHHLSEAKIILVDDVMTTGATLEAAAKELLAGGASRVDAIVFALA